MKKKLIIIIPIVVALLVFIGLYAYTNYKDEKTNLTVVEKKWIESNSGTKFDFEITNNIPVYSLDGTGVIFDFIEDFEVDTGLEFNKISYLKENNPTTNGLKIQILNNDTNLTDKDLLISEDGYIAVSKQNIRYDKVDEIKTQTIGVFVNDIGELSYYLKTGSELTYKTYDNITTMIADLEAGNITMMIIPQVLYLDQTIANPTTYINYYFTEMSKKIVITLTNDNEDLNNVVRKYFERWKEKNYVEAYNKQYLNYYTTLNKINDKTKAELISKTSVFLWTDTMYQRLEKYCNDFAENTKIIKVSFIKGVYGHE